MDTQNPLTFFWLAVTTLFEVGLGLSAYLVYAKVIPFLNSKASRLVVPDGVVVRNPIARFIVGPVIYKVPNRWWWRLLFARGLSYLVIVTVSLNVLLSVGWRNPFVSTEPINGLPSMAGWAYDLIFARANNLPNGAHLVSYIGIPILGLYSMWKFKDEFMGPLVAAFFVAMHEGPWQLLYYAAYSQYLSLTVITNVLKDISFTSMVILFALAFWQYPNRKIPMKEFKFVFLIYLGMTLAWFLIPWFFGYGLFPITAINNFAYGKGIYSQTQYWADPTINLLEVFSWLGLFFMFQYVLVKWKAR